MLSLFLFLVRRPMGGCDGTPSGGLVGVGKRAPHGFQCPCLVSPHGSLDRLKSLYIISSSLDSKRQTTQALGTR